MAVAKDDFANFSTGFAAPASHVMVVTPSDEDDLPAVTRWLWIAGGTIRVTTAGGDDVTIGGTIQAMIPLRVRKVWATGTTAVGIHAFW